MSGIDLNSQVWMSHADTIVNLPKNSNVIASTKDVRVAGYELRKKTAFGLQFHPEVYHSTQGSTLLKNFLVRVGKTTHTTHDTEDVVVRGVDANLGG